MHYILLSLALGAFVQAAPVPQTNINVTSILQNITSAIPSTTNIPEVRKRTVADEQLEQINLNVTAILQNATSAIPSTTSIPEVKKRLDVNVTSIIQNATSAIPSITSIPEAKKRTVEDAMYDEEAAVNNIVITTDRTTDTLGKRSSLDGLDAISLPDDLTDDDAITELLSTLGLDNSTEVTTLLADLGLDDDDINPMLQSLDFEANVTVDQLLRQADLSDDATISDLLSELDLDSLTEKAKAKRSLVDDVSDIDLSSLGLSDEDSC